MAITKLDGATQILNGSVGPSQANLGTTWAFTAAPTYNADPSGNNELCRKSYVDALVQGLDVHGSVVRATTAALPAYAYLTSVITATANGVLPNIDGSSIALSARLIVKNETAGNAKYNGIYVVTDLGTPNSSTLTDVVFSLSGGDDVLGTKVGHGLVTGNIVTISGCTQAYANATWTVTRIDNDTFTLNTASWVLFTGADVTGDVAYGGTPFILTRAIDANTTAKMGPGAFCFIESGSSYADTGWVMTADAGFVLDTDAVSWVQFSSAGVYTAGSGISISSGAIAVKLDATTAASSGLELTGNGVRLKFADTALAYVAADAGVKLNLASNPGLQISSGLLLKLDATTAASSGLELNGNGVRLKLADSTLSYAATDGGVKVGLNATASGLEVSSGLRIDCKDTSVAIDGSGLYVNLASNPGLEVNSGLKIDLDATTAASSGLELTSNGVRAKLADYSLAYVAADAGLKVLLDTAGAIGLDSGNAGLEVKVDGSTIDINTNALIVKSAGITVTQLANDAVESAKIKNANVTFEKLATAASGRLGTYDRRTDAVGDGATVNFDLGHSDAEQSSTGILVFKGGVLQTSGGGADYTLSDGGGAGGVDRVVFNAAPATGVNISIMYKRTGDTK